MCTKVDCSPRKIQGRADNDRIQSVNQLVRHSSLALAMCLLSSAPPVTNAKCSQSSATPDENLAVVENNLPICRSHYLLQMMASLIRIPAKLRATRCQHQLNLNHPNEL